MLVKINAFLTKYENAVVALLVIIFIAVNMQGLKWGIPGYWNVDEIVRFADEALSSDSPQFDQTDDLTYPSLPKYVLYFVGKMVYALGYPYERFRWAARMLSVLLGAASIFLVFKITRVAGGKTLTALMSAGLAMTFAQLSVDSHFAHNDIYVTFFSLLAILALLWYQKTSKRILLYATFFTIGLAASSKYTGGVLVLAALIIYVLTENKGLLKDWMQTLETLFISICLTFLGFALGTPRALFWMAFYFKRIPHTLYLLSNYNRTEATRIGFLQEWGLLHSMLGTPVFILMILGLVASFVFLFAPVLRKKSKLPRLSNGTITLLVVAVTLNLPMMISYIVLPRYFLSFVLVAFILSALTMEMVIASLPAPKFRAVSIVLGGAVTLTILVSALRIVSVILLFENDARIPASEYLHTLPKGLTIEYTAYPPNIPLDYFARQRNYPIDVVKFEDEVVTDERYNQGETGLLERHPDYLIVDNLTYDRFQDPYICAWNQVECDFFKRLLADETDYHLIAVFSYDLPDFLPDLKIAFLNPIIRVYQSGD